MLRAPLIISPLLVLALLTPLPFPSTADPVQAAEYACQPTRPDGQGPFYRAGAPVRNKVGKGYLLHGTVKSARDCRVLPGAKIEIWMNGPAGKYGNDWWATLYSNKWGNYAFESHVPVPYGSRPPHIHMIVNAPGYEELITQHYPLKGADSGLFHLVLIPDDKP